MGLCGPNKSIFMPLAPSCVYPSPPHCRRGFGACGGPEWMGFGRSENMRMPIVFVALAALSAILPACANPEAAKASRAAAVAQADNEDDAQCRAGGAAPGSQAYDDCRSHLVEARAKADSAREQRKAAFQQTTGAGTEALSGH